MVALQAVASHRYTRFCWLLLILAGFFSCKSDPTSPQVKAGNLEISAAALEIYGGGTIQLRATTQNSDGSTSDVTEQAIWSNSPAEAGAISNKGLFTAANNIAGTESIKAKYQGIEATIQIEVTLRARFFTIYPVIAKVAAGTALQLTATATFPGGEEAFVTGKTAWSLNPGIAAEIDATGRLRALPGKTGIESVEGKYQTFSVSREVEIQAEYQSPFEMVLIPAGTFQMGDNNGEFDEKPEHEVYVSAFEIGKYEVTNGQYADYLNQALALDVIRHEEGFIFGNRAPHQSTMYTRINQPGLEGQFIFYIESGEGGLGTFKVKAGFEAHPVGRMTWYGADAFCRFYGLRLPTEAEWEKAARAGLQLEYATQDGSLSHDLANFAGTGGLDIFPAGAPVGSFPPNQYGLYDMAGNAEEIVFDQYAEDYYQNSPRENPYGVGPEMPIHLLEILVTIIRGGNWNSSAPAIRAAYRGKIVEPHHNVVIIEWAGFRVARTLL